MFSNSVNHNIPAWSRFWTEYPPCRNKKQTHHPLSTELPLLLQTVVVYHWPHERYVSARQTCYSLFSSVFVWELIANCLALIDESFASAGKLDGCGFLLLCTQQKQLWEEEPCVNSSQTLRQSVVLLNFKSSSLSPLIAHLRSALWWLNLMCFVVFCSYMTDGGLGLYTRRLNRMPDSMAAVRENLHRNTSSGQGDADR